MIRRLLTENAGLKLLSLLLGVVVFVAVRTEAEVTTTVAIRLVLTEPRELVNTADVPPELVVRVSGTAGTVRSFPADAPRELLVDLSGLPPGVSTVRIHERELQLPPGLEVISISPAVLTVRLEPREKKLLPVKITLRGEPAPGYVVGAPELEPAKVEVEGPRRELREGAHVRTGPVDVAGVTREVVAEVGLDPPGLASRVLGRARARVRVPVVPEEAERVLRLEVANVPGAAAPVRIEAKVRGPRAKVEALDEAALRGVPEARARPPYPVRIEGLPEGVLLVEPAPTVGRPRGS